jgi:(S)-2-hydroxyglutarate dehydrogenase
MYDYAIIGGGIVGLSTAWALTCRDPARRVLVLEKEPDWAKHQTGRNSGVIHSGIYYKPGSLKARLSREGNRSMLAFCEEHGIPYQACGKVIVATEDAELPLLENLCQRGIANGLTVTRLTAEQVREIEPHVRCRRGIRVPSTGIVAYRQVCLKLVELITDKGGEMKTHSEVIGIHANGASQIITTRSGEYKAKRLINCAGLHSDRVARLGQNNPSSKIVPFRGEYYEVVPNRRHLIKSLIYPVPNPDFPFLGVHFTRMIDGSVHAGPNAVLSFKREGYHRSDFSLRDFSEVMLFPGFWKMATRNLNEGLKEMYRSFSKAAFVRSLQKLVPEICTEDLVPSEAGVRAQALQPTGALVDDFLLAHGPNAVHVLNAPSPAATAALEIGKAIAAQVPAL